MKVGVGMSPTAIGRIGKAADFVYSRDIGIFRMVRLGKGEKEGGRRL